MSISHQASAVLSVEDLSVRYRLPRRSLFAAPEWFAAVTGATFSVGKGASLALVGESGSGKSSLAKAVMGLEPASAGAIRLFGQDLASLSANELRELRRRFQMVFQDPYSSLDPRHSIQRIVIEPLRDVARTEARERAAEVLSHVGLGVNDLGKYPHQFSGGQRQRIAIARALVTKPDLIVADEPVSALDVSVQAQVLNLMQDLQAQYGMAYLFISHDLAVVEYLCEDVVVLYRGRVVEIGKTREVMKDPAHPYTQELVNAMPRLGGGKRRPAAKQQVKAGSPDENANAAGACPYMSRCPRAAEVCRVAPSLRALGNGRSVACHLS
ncbi:MAG: peptide ABC transporter ATP-binding protein [Hyphomicrobium sp. SCN 65-11]|nr:MAG: peptide ABC transporter ATP-binding protein [Hyphomicrobium sp. SCN 65-11]